MTDQMNWNRLLSATRWGQRGNWPESKDLARTDFQRDFDRLIFSSPFRRLQNKTQVFPLPGSVFVHNRLTHSLEVACVGRSLGKLFYQQMKAEYPNIDQEIPNLAEVGNIISAACLSHDLGNPAFGHSGEAAISHYFKYGAGSILNGQRLQELVTPARYQDLIHFEGNANALRILTHAFKGKDPKGFDLTYATLGAIIKYPCAAVDGHQKKILHRKKYGFFDSEQEAFQNIVNHLGLLSDPDLPEAYLRHPLVYLVEAADDICYNIIDFEDAHRLGILSYQEVEDHLLPLAGDDKLPQRLRELEDLESKVGLLRAKAINTLTQACSSVFFQNREVILQGKFRNALMDQIEPGLAAVMQKISDVSVARIYNAPTVVQIEVAGYKVMGGILEEFLPAFLNKSPSKMDEKLRAMVPRQFHPLDDDPYTRIRAVLDYVSGMTDLYAVDLFRKIKGISFPTLD